MTPCLRQPVSDSKSRGNISNAMNPLPNKLSTKKDLVNHPHHGRLFLKQKFIAVLEK